MSDLMLRVFTGSNPLVQAVIVATVLGVFVTTARRRGDQSSISFEIKNRETAEARAARYLMAIYYWRDQARQQWHGRQNDRAIADAWATLSKVAPVNWEPLVDLPEMAESKDGPLVPKDFTL